MKKGFTLIELLVVITIIGILATGAVTTFTSQIQKARDTTRISDITALRGGVEQYYQDGGAYPSKGGSFTGVTAYVPKLPKDPKTSQFSTNSIFEYLYNVSQDKNGILAQEFEFSTHFENSGNQLSKAATDGGDDPQRMEIGIDINDTLGSPGTKETVVAGSAGVSQANLTCITDTRTNITCVDGDDNPMLIR